MAAEEPIANEAQESDAGAKRRLAWLPWVVLAAVLMTIAWLLYTYADLGSPPNVKSAATVARTAVVPDVVGFDRVAALRQLEDAGFDVAEETSYDALSEPGTVATQDPVGGSKVAVGSEVLIGVSAEANVGFETGIEQDFGPKAPDVVGLNEASARDLLERGGYGISVSYTYSDAQPQGVVYAQSPSAGEPAESGSTISVWVSKGAAAAPKVTVPSLVGLTTAAAINKIEAAGLTARPMVQPKAGKVGIVYQQQPAAGNKVVPGRQVFILVGSKP